MMLGITFVDGRRKRYKSGSKQVTEVYSTWGDRMVPIGTIETIWQNRKITEERTIAPDGSVREGRNPEWLQRKYGVGV